MRAFHNDEKIKQKYLERVRAHRLADEIVQGHYWENGKGCAVGCTIHGSSHKAYESELGIPAWLAHLEDRLFEGMPLERAKLWPEQFLSSIHPGADLDLVKGPFLVFVLEQSLQHFNHKEYPEVKSAVDQSITLWQRKDIGSEKFLAAADAAYAAADAAYAAVAVAVAAVAYAAVAYAAAARAAANAANAANAARAAAYAARAAAYAAAARAAADADAAANAAANAAAEFTKFADKLLELLAGNQNETVQG